MTTSYDQEKLEEPSKMRIALQIILAEKCVSTRSEGNSKQKGPLKVIVHENL